MRSIDAGLMLFGSLLTITGWLARRVSMELRDTMKHDDVLTEICAAAEDLLRMVAPDKYDAASLKYNHIRRLSRSIMKVRPKAPYARTFSYKPELRVGK